MFTYEDPEFYDENGDPLLDEEIESEDLSCDCILCRDLGDVDFEDDIEFVDEEEDDEDDWRDGIACD